MSYFHSKERRNLLVFLVHFTYFISSSKASITLTVSPSGPVVVNRTVTIQCTYESNPLAAIFFTSTNSVESFCDLSSDSTGNMCISSLCSSTYNATCLNYKTYSVLYPVPQSWNGKGVYCRGLITGDERSNQVNFSVIVSVTSVTLTPAQITVDAGKQITLTCQTDYCNPAANITWYKASTVLATPTTDNTDTDSNGLIRTTSVLQYTGVVVDNGQQVYCRANNRPGKNVDSNKYTLDVRYPPSTAPVIIASPPGLQYNTGTRVTLTCQLPGGNPVATLSWKFISEVLILPSPVLNLLVGQRHIFINCFVEHANPEENIEYRWIRSDGSNSSIVASSQTYVIKTVSFEDSGRYICTASNSVGNSSGIIDVSVQFTPLAPRIEYVVCKSTFATITWTTPYTAYNDVKLQETLQYSKLNKNFVNVTNEQLNSTDTNTHNQKVTMLKPGTEYTFRLLTSNRYGVTFSNKNYQGCDKGQIIGGTLGGFAFFFILAMCFVILYKHRQRKGTPVETRNQNASYVDQFSNHDVHQYEGISTDSNKGTLNTNFYEKIEASNSLDKRDEYMELPDSSYKDVDKSTEVDSGLYSNTK